MNSDFIRPGLSDMHARGFHVNEPHPECVVCAVIKERDAFRAEADSLRDAVELARDWSEPFRGPSSMTQEQFHDRMLEALAAGGGR